MLHTVYYGNTLENWLISLLIIFIALVVNKVIVKLNKNLIQKLTVKSRTPLDDIFFQSLEKPILLGIMLLAIWIAINRLTITPKAYEIISTSYQVLVTLNITWFFTRLASALLEEYTTPKGNSGFTFLHFSMRLLPLIKRTVLILIWIIGLVTALNNVGVKVTTLLGTLGIGGIAFALAAQDTIKNIFGRITIFTDRPFSIGDTINFNNIEGTVEDIGIRSTRIRTGDKRLVTIPNSNIMDAAVTNISLEPARRVTSKLNLTYNTDDGKMQQALTILKDIFKETDGVSNTDQTILFSEFAASALVISYTYFIKKTADINQTTSTVNFEILKRFKEAGLTFAFPSQTLYVENMQQPENKEANTANNPSSNTKE
ncbi:MAG: mechanosensitive ion channel family protein [Candidatus Azobacteroides sp.]|nr:mechanosensitive ion channel family protein [Candidatus Azobacteroides sp.]